MSTIICNFCNKTFSTISSLNKHKETASYCIKIQNNSEGFQCRYCSKIFQNKKIIDKHNEECEQNSILNTKEAEITKYKILLEAKEKEFESYKLEKEKQIKELRDMVDKANMTIADIAKQPKTIIRGNQTIHNILSDYSTYKEHTSYDRIISIAKEDKDFDKYFDKGQVGIAQFVSDKIVNTEDGKMIICCTDPTRKRFKYHSKNKGITEDIEARHFTKKIAKPIKEVCQIVHSNIQRDLETVLVDKLEKDQIKKRKEWSYEKLSEISQFDDNKRNQEYRRELCVLLSRKSPEEYDEYKNNIDDIDNIDYDKKEECEEIYE